ncbi:MAG: L-aspartate oxidase [Acidobacteria bacterium]|nr:L-aspartate oxidase [Acidobacteriota bacterium]
MAEKVDFLVIGSGIAGLTFALEASAHGSVLVVTKSEPSESSTRYAQGGIASVLGKDDSFQAHVDDTFSAGAGICETAMVELVVRSGPERIRWLESLGVEFSTTATGDRDLGLEGGHSRRRVAHVEDMTGRSVEQVLLERVSQTPNVRLVTPVIAIDLITADKVRHAGDANRCLGAYILDLTTNCIQTILARCTFLATGGCGKVYLVTSNPDVATGDGIAMAYRAGARVANMEFIQFHPTCLYHHKAKSFLISEALRGEGGVLINAAGHPFMDEYHPQGSLAPRDIVARGIDAELKRSGADSVFLDMTHLPADFLQERFPNIHQRCLELGIDIRFEPIPVVPGAHYCCGGVIIDADGRTDLPGLYAAGEVTYSGVHGANRLASNSLLEALVFGHRAADSAGQELQEKTFRFPREVPEWNMGLAIDSDEKVVVTQAWDEIRSFMWRYVSIVRSNTRLERAARRIDLVREEINGDWWRSQPFGDLVELRNLARVAQLIIQSALMRHESRGLHYNLDYPDADDAHFRRPTVLWRGRRRR